MLRRGEALARLQVEFAETGGQLIKEFIHYQGFQLSLLLISAVGLSSHRR